MQHDELGRGDQCDGNRVAIGILHPGHEAAARVTLLHITSAAEWAAAQRSGVHAPPMLAQDGFLHLCTTAQLDYVLGRHFVGRTGLVALHLDPAKLDDVRWENSVPGRDLFPHLYGPLPAAAVLRAEPLP